MNNAKELKCYIKDGEIDLDKIINDFSPYIRKIINNMARENLNYEDKEEILADTFFILWKNQNKNIMYLDAYIAGITRNLIKEKLDKKNVIYNIEDYENFIFYNSDIDVFLEERVEIERCLKVLKKKELEIFNMFYYYSKSTKEISYELGISEINVCTKLSRIRKKIRKEFYNKGGHYGR